MTNKPFQLNRTNARLLGVCAGIAEYLAVDPLMVRVVTASLVLLGAGSIIPLYGLVWLLTPGSR